MTTAIVDASIALKWFVREADSDQARLLLQPGIERLAPDLVLAELANGLRRRERLKQIDKATVEAAIDGAARMFQSIAPLGSLVSSAVHMSRTLNHSTYDCFCLALALEQGARLVTADAKFTAKVAASPYAPHVVLLRDWKG